jgi:hypothetical protein
MNDHNFRPIFGEKIGVFLKNQCRDQIFAKTSSFSKKNTNIFAKCLGDFLWPEGQFGDFKNILRKKLGVFDSKHCKIILKQENVVGL